MFTVIDTIVYAENAGNPDNSAGHDSKLTEVVIAKLG